MVGRDGSHVGAAPSSVPHATEYIDQMVDFVGTLLTTGSAYETEDGVYLDSASVPDYGLLKHQNLSELRAGTAGRS